MRIIDRFKISEPARLGLIAILVGLGSGVGVWLFKSLIDLVHELVYVKALVLFSSIGSWGVLWAPISGGLIVGLILHFFIGEERHHGVAGIIEAVALAGGRLRYRRMPLKAIAAAISIGSGASVGPEDPSVQIGANLGSFVGQRLHLSDERTRSFVAAGAAGAIAAAFNAPIAGVFFAIEIIMGDFSSSSAGVIVISAVVSSTFTQAISGAQPAFRVPAYAFNSAWELPLYLVLGLLAGTIAASYVRLLYYFHDFFERWVSQRWLRPIVAGVVTGVVGVFIPQIFGVGYETIEKILYGVDLGVLFLLILMLAKLMVTSICIAGGFPGGVFAPALFIGAALGAGYGELVSKALPMLNLDPPAFAMVGMASVLAGSIHAPFTAILLLFEMTHDYRIILPLMFAVMVGMLISQRFDRDSVYQRSLSRKGIRLERGRDVEVLEGIRVYEVMQREVLTLQEDEPLEMAIWVFNQTRHHGLPVVNRLGELTGILTLQDVDRIEPEPRKKARIGDVCSRNIITVFGDETIANALRYMGAFDIGRLAVVERGNPKHLVGWLRRSDVIRAYDQALTRRAAMRHRAQQARLGILQGDDTGIHEWVIEPGAPCVGKRVREIQWPEECIVASLRRGRQLIVPHGETVLQVGDIIVTVSGNNANREISKICSRAESKVMDA